MDRSEIKLNQILYDALVRSIHIASNRLNPDYKKPELSGFMPSVNEVINTFEDISDTINNCRLMCIRLEGNLKSAADIIQEQDKGLAGKK